MSERVTQLLSDLNLEASGVRTAFDDLFDPGLGTVPIPFFGEVVSAKVITIGLNPSDGEFRGRGWPRPVDLPTLSIRLTQYFSNSRFPCHPWFSTWEQALNEIGVSYNDGTAAHLDLCPWATRPMSMLPDHTRFEALVTQSLPWFWRSMELCANARLVLMAGAVTKRYYMNEFLAKSSAPRNMAFTGKVPRGGTAFVGYHRLRIDDKELPVFFCSVSPSARNSHLLPERVRENAAGLRAKL